MIALVAPEIDDGPLNIVLGDWPDALGNVQPGMPVTYEPDRLVLHSFAIDLSAADVWEPCPDWGDLREQRAVIEASLEPLAVLCLEHDPDNALLSLLGAPFPDRGRVALLVDRFLHAAGQLEAGWKDDEGALAEGGAALAGLGDGLTPAGDDFLVGFMLWAWLAHPRPQVFCPALCEAAAPRTTTLSAAFLRAAASGQCSAAWHRLLAALAQGRAAGIAGAAQEVLAHGASSGQDALIGFLYLSGIKEGLCR